MMVSLDRLRLGVKACRHRMGMRSMKVPHIGTETRTKLLREAAVRNIGQWAEA